MIKGKKPRNFKVIQSKTKEKITVEDKDFEKTMLDIGVKPITGKKKRD